MGDKPKFTPGPWQVWSGPSYVGGGADLCIGAGETWLANMDHRNCVNREQHVCGGKFEPCRMEPDTDICSTSGCRCGEECPEENHISEEQLANAHLIAASPTLLAAAQKALDCITRVSQAFYDEDERYALCVDASALLGVAIAKAEWRKG